MSLKLAFMGTPPFSVAPLAALISAVLCLILIGFVLLFVVYFGALVLTIIAAVKVSNGDYEYRYPMTLRLLK